MFVTSQEVITRTRKRRALLISDLDGTLIPPEWQSDLARTLDRFGQLITERSDLGLAYATGRGHQLAMQGIRKHNLPLPDSLICDVGSSVYHRRGDRMEADGHYESLMEAILGQEVRSALPGLVEGLRHVRLQEEEKQARFKVSFYVDPEMAEADALERVRERLGRLRHQVDVVFSVDPADRRGLLDLMPAGVSKASAAHYLRSRLGLEPEDVVYAGDSGNDTAAFLAGFKAILVGNAPEGFRARIRELARSRGLEDRFHYSRASYISGVLEGCERFGLS